MTREQFDSRFKKMPMERPGFEGLRRNAAIVLGNHGNSSAVPALIAALQDDSPLVRGAAAWSLGKLGGLASQLALSERLQVDCDDHVRNEISAALAATSAAVTP